MPVLYTFLFCFVFIFVCVWGGWLHKKISLLRVSLQNRKSCILFLPPSCVGPVADLLNDTWIWAVNEDHSWAKYPDLICCWSWKGLHEITDCRQKTRSYEFKVANTIQLNRIMSLSCDFVKLDSADMVCPLGLRHLGSYGVVEFVEVSGI